MHILAELVSVMAHTRAQALVDKTNERERCRRKNALCIPSKNKNDESQVFYEECPTECGGGDIISRE